MRAVWGRLVSRETAVDEQEVAVDHRPREHGVSKYTNFSRLPRGILDLFGFWWYRRRHIAPQSGQQTPA